MRFAVLGLVPGRPVRHIRASGGARTHAERGDEERGRLRRRVSAAALGHRGRRDLPAGGHEPAALGRERLSQADAAVGSAAGACRRTPAATSSCAMSSRWMAKPFAIGSSGSSGCSAMRKPATSWPAIIRESARYNIGKVAAERQHAADAVAVSRAKRLSRASSSRTSRSSQPVFGDTGRAQANELAVFRVSTEMWTVRIRRARAAHDHDGRSTTAATRACRTQSRTGAVGALMWAGVNAESYIGARVRVGAAPRHGHFGHDAGPARESSTGHRLHRFHR